MIEIVTVVPEHLIKTSDEIFRRHRAEAEQDDSGMRPGLTNNQLTKVPVTGDDYSALSNGDGQDVDVSQRGRVILTNCRDIVTLPPQVGRDPVVGALVEQKARTHAPGNGDRQMRLMQHPSVGCA